MTEPGEMAEPGEQLDERRIEERFLGPLRYTRKEIEALSGIPEDFGLQLWRALGFPTPPEDAVAFTEADVEALNEIRELLRNDLIDEDLVLHMARAVGQTMGRLASWLEGVRMEWLRGQIPENQQISNEAMATVFEATDELRPRFEKLLVHGWRRQAAATAIRSFSSIIAETRDPATGTALLGVGFADVVSFTRLSRRMDGDELAAFVERFETTAAEEITERKGRVVKTLGDEVFFVADDARTTIEIGLSIAERCEGDPDLPQVRVGLAYGEVILRLGDVFGTPVNLAARLTSVAYPGSVLADGELARAIADENAYDVTTTRPRSLQGLGRVRPRLIRRSEH